MANASPKTSTKQAVNEENNDSLDFSALNDFTIVEPSGVEIPQAIKDFVERAHNEWKANPKGWASATLPSPAHVKEAEKLARRYATEVRETPLTFRLYGKANPNELKCRVTDKVTRGVRRAKA